MPPENLPPVAAGRKVRTRKVIDIAQAVAKRAKVPVLDITKRRLYQDWLRGLTPATLTVVYGDRVLGALRVGEVDSILREVARQDRDILSGPRNTYVRRVA